MGHSTAAAVWVEGTDLPVDDVFRLICAVEPEVAGRHLKMSVFERSSPPATLLHLVLDGLGVHAENVFVEAPNVIARTLQVRTWWIRGFAGSSDWTAVTGYAATGEVAWEVADEGATGVGRLLAETGANEGCLTVHVRPYLEPDSAWKLRAKRRVGVPEVPWTPSTRSVAELQAAVGAPVPFSPGPSFTREREFQGEPETQVLAKLAPGAPYEGALELLGRKWVELEPMPAYGVESEESVALLGNPGLARHFRLTVRETDTVLSVVHEVVRGGHWVVVTVVHAPPSADDLELVAESLGED